MTSTARPRLKFGFDKFSGLYLWAGFIVLFAIWEPGLFPTSATIHSIAAGQSIAAIEAIALLVPLVAGAYDLSIGAVINLSAIVVTWLQTQQHWGMWPAILAAILVCAAIGIVNGFFVVKMHVNSFIVTLATATVVAAFQTIVSNNEQPLPPTSSAWTNLTQRSVFGFQIIFVYLIVIALIAWWVLDHTPAGRYLYAIGGNSEAARLSGVNVGRWTWLSLVTSASLSGLAGVFYASLYGPSLVFGQALLLPAFAAVFLGSTQLRPGKFNLWGTMIAVFALATGVAGFMYVTGVQWLNDMFNGVALLVAVSFAVTRQRAAGNRRPRPAAGRTGNSEPPANSDPVNEPPTEISESLAT